MVFGIIFTIIGATFAFFGARANATSNAIGGTSYTLNMTLDVTAIRAGDLVPTADNLIATSLAGNYQCVDQRNYGLCSLYRLRFTNSSSAVTMVGYLKTSSTTYTTTNLRYRLYELSNSTYTAVSDIGMVSITTNATNYFMSGANNVSVTIPANSTKDYYLVIWLHDIGENQLEDQNKSYTGSITFTSQSGATVSSNFITS